MIRLSVTVPPQLLNEAIQVSHAASKRQAIEWALEELIRSFRRRKAASHAGKIPLRYGREELIRLRRMEH